MYAHCGDCTEFDLFIFTCFLFCACSSNLRGARQLGPELCNAIQAVRRVPLFSRWLTVFCFRSFSVFGRTHHRFTSWANDCSIRLLSEAKDGCSLGRPLRIGYVSGDFFTHSVSYFIEVSTLATVVDLRVQMHFLCSICPGTSLLIDVFCTRRHSVSFCTIQSQGPLAFHNKARTHVTCYSNLEVGRSDN